MKKAIFSLLLVVSLCAFVNAQNSSGTIYYENGKTLKFFSMERFSANIIGNNSPNQNAVQARYKETIRTIPFDKVERIEIIQFTNKPGYPNMIFDVKVEIKTKTGVTFVTDYFRMEGIRVFIQDEIAGVKTEQGVTFGVLGKINIRKIIFN